MTRTAISPRFATRTRLNTVEREAGDRLELEQQLPELDRLRSLTTDNKTWLAELERTRYDNPLFVPITFEDFTPGYDTNSAVLFPETVAVREAPERWTWGAIFCDREAARFRTLPHPAAAETIERWRTLRQANLRICESLSPAEWARVGVHSERGPESVRLNIELLAGHDRMHLEQFRRGLG